MKNIKLESIKIKLRSKYIKATKKIRRKRITSKNFTIISNNCWAGFVYQSYNMEYNTPTVGLFFMADDYIKFVSNLRHYMSIDEINFIEPHNSKWYENLKNISKFGEYPIGKLGDIEIQFLHYKNKDEAQYKWNKRKERVNYKNILYKFSEMNECTEKQIIAFQKLKLKNKLCFVSGKYKKLCNDFTFQVTERNFLNASDEPFGKSRKVNVDNIINNLKKGD